METWIKSIGREIFHTNILVNIELDDALGSESKAFYLLGFKTLEKE
ncbi:MAG: hypothetical protein LBE04_07855 [Prevotellaceae bacterium]|jgi:hypothetical protein|nr:hypothetical protein [Prevotellaceae bacterium]